MKTSRSTIFCLMLASGLLHFAVPLVPAVCLDDTAGCSKVWRVIEQPDYTLQVNNLGGGTVGVGKSRFPVPGLSFFAGGRSCSMGTGLCGTGAWTSVTGSVAEAAGITEVVVAGVIQDIRVRMVYQVEPQQTTWEWTAEVFDPTPDMRWFRFEGMFMYCTGLPFTVWLRDGTMRRGVLDPATFREMGNVKRVEVLTPAHRVTIDWLDASGVVIRPNQSAQQPHIPLRYLCSAAEGTAAEPRQNLMPGERVRIRMRIKILPLIQHTDLEGKQKNGQKSS